MTVLTAAYMYMYSHGDPVTDVTLAMDYGSLALPVIEGFHYIILNWLHVNFNGNPVIDVTLAMGCGSQARYCQPTLFLRGVAGDA